MINMAFVCWNRFLDMSEAIEEGNLSMLENADFADTDVPFDIELPRENLPVRCSQWAENLRKKYGKKSGTGYCKCHWIKK